MSGNIVKGNGEINVNSRDTNRLEYNSRMNTNIEEGNRVTSMNFEEGIIDLNEISRSDFGFH